MGINLDKPHLWKRDINASVDLYNTWFMDFAPKAFRETRVSTAKSVEQALQETNYLNNVSPGSITHFENVYLSANSKRQIGRTCRRFKKSCAEHGGFRESAYFAKNAKGEID